MRYDQELTPQKSCQANVALVMGLTQPATSRLRLKTFLSLLLLLVTTATYWQLWQNDFVNYDDDIYIQGNRYVRAGVTSATLRWALMEVGYAGNWHPLTWISLQIDQTLFGWKALGFHFTNLCFHLANSVLLLHVLERMTGALWRSALVAALFALHPLHVESVAWVAERKDVLSTFFWLLTMAAYASYVFRPGVIRYLLVLLAFGFGLMAKPMLVTLPCVLLLLDYWPLGRVRLRGQAAAEVDSAGSTVNSARLWLLLAEKIPLFGLVAASSWLTLIAQNRGLALMTVSLDQRLANSLVATVMYLSQTFWPASLAILYPYPTAGFSIFQEAAALGLIMLVSGLVLWRVRLQPYLLVGWLWFLGTLVPVSGLVVQVSIQSRADRYTYVPLIGLFIALTWGLADFVNRLRVPKRLVYGATAVMVTVCAVASGRQVAIWRDSVTLWEHALAVTQDNYMAHTKLGTALLEMKRFKAARFHFEKALQIRSFSLGEYNLGRVSLDEGDRVGAIRHFEDALATDPDNPVVHYRLALVYDAMEMLQAAFSHYQAAWRNQPGNPGLLRHLELVRMRQAADPQAISALTAALPQDPNPGEICDAIGWQLALEGKEKEAEAAFHRAVEMLPLVTKYSCDLAQILGDLEQKQLSMEIYRTAAQRDPGWLEALNYSAWSLATEPHPEFRDSSRAIRLARQACEATAYQEADYLDTLGAAYAAAGKFDEASALVHQALLAGSKKADADWVAAVQTRRQRYAQHRAYYADPEAAVGSGKFR
jgi:tetratricopeptide (TPR) repeat protein